jgi:adenylosuccinate lyase
VVPALQRVYAVTVELLPDVLDTEAKTVEHDMRKGGIEVVSLRQARTFLVRAAGPKTPEAARVGLERVSRYAKETLHNAVMEQVRVEVVQ